MSVCACVGLAFVCACVGLAFVCACVALAFVCACVVLAFVCVCVGLAFVCVCVGLAFVCACVGLAFVCCSAHSSVIKGGGDLLRFTFIYFDPFAGVLSLPGTEFSSATLIMQEFNAAVVQLTEAETCSGHIVKWQMVVLTCAFVV